MRPQTIPTTTVDALRARKILGRDNYLVPQKFGLDGWCLRHINGTTSVIITVAAIDGAEWIHASIAARAEMPSYEDMKRLHRAAFGNGYAYQVFAPPTQHVNIHQYALHLWGRVDGRPMLPEFGAEGSI